MKLSNLPKLTSEREDNYQYHKAYYTNICRHLHLTRIKGHLSEHQ